jgi:hypothetical protein
MNMIDHKAKTIDDEIVPYSKNRKNRIVHDVIFHIVENIEGGWLEFDYVPGEGEIRESEAEATGMVVVIGTRLNRDKINSLFRLA